MMVLSEVEFNFAVFSIKICLRLTHHNLHVYYMVLNVKKSRGQGFMSIHVELCSCRVVFESSCVRSMMFDLTHENRISNI